MRQLLFFFFFSLIGLQTSFAVTINWFGGDGYWHESSNWSTGTVPTFADDVVILSGTVKVLGGTYAQAQSVQVANTGHLTINLGARLTCRGASSTSGLSVSSSMSVKGYLIVEQITHPYGITVSGNGFFEVSNNGGVYIGDVGIGLWNNADVINRGKFTIENTSSNGIVNYGLIKNLDGGLQLFNINLTAIVCESSPTLNGDFINETYLGIKGANSGMVIEQDCLFENRQDGYVEISYTSTGVYLSDEDASFDNQGDLLIREGSGSYTYGIQSGGIFYNASNASIDIDEVKSGIYNGADASFYNDGNVELNEDIDTYAIDNSTDFYNGHCGKIKISAPIKNRNQGNLVNKGWMYNNSTTMSLNYNSFNNYGVIEDLPQTLSPVLSNYRVITHPLTGNVEEGDPVSNALMLGSLSGYTVDGWYTSAAAQTSAGSYNATTNEWTPNAAAVGLNRVYVKFTKNYYGCSEVFAVDIPGGVLPFSSSDEEAFAGQHGVEQQSAARFQLYPNPSNGIVNISLPFGGKEVQYISVYDASGKLVLEQTSGVQGYNNITLDLTNYATGLYWVKILDKKGGIEQRAVVIE